MSGIMEMFGAGSRANKAKGPATNLRVQSSVEGRPRATGAGQNRLGGNVIWYGDYKATSHAAAAGGKGGAFTGKGATGNYTYSASFVVSIGETIAAVQSINNGSEYDFFYVPPAPLLASLEARGIKVTYGNTFGATFLLGGYAQSAWSYLTTAHPDQALAYRGEALACFPNLGLGTTASLPNFNLELLWPLNSDVPAFGPDANPADWVAAFLSNADWGAGFPSVLQGDFADYRTWARATSLLISPLVNGQVAANAHLAEIMQGTVSDFVWSGGALQVLPYADGSATGNGYTYAPDLTPIYDLTPTDFMPVQHGPDTGDQVATVKISRTDPTQAINQIKLEYLDRANLYNPVTIYNQDDALIISARRARPADTRSHHFFCSVAAASSSAALQMRREKVLAQFYFRLPPQFILLDPMDIVTLTEPLLKLDRTAVRITEIQKGEDGSLSFTAEEFFGNVDEVPLYDRQEPLGSGRNVNQAPGGINAPMIFEPPEQVSDGLVVYAAVSGLDQTIWGGCNVWVATEAGGTYQQVGQVVGNARMGLLTDIFPTIAEAPSGPTIDYVDTLKVDLSQSSGELTSGSLADMTAINTACWVDGEIIAYQVATLTGSYAYDLVPTLRGAYGSTIAEHAANTNFVRLDDRMIKVPFTADRVGSTMYLKFQSFNIYGGGLEELSDIGSYAYVITGAALSSPLPDITAIRTSYKDKTSNITWDEVDDFRAPYYEVRIGDDWDTGLSLGTVAHPPFTTFGDGKYLVKARAEPLPGLIVYSENALSQVILGSTLPDNLVATYDESATGWTGTVTGPGAIVGGNFVTTDTYVPAYYTVPAGHIFNVMWDRATRIAAAWKVAGVTVGDNILTNPDFLGTSDILGSSATQYVDGWVEIFVAVGDEDVYDLPDVYDPPDIFDAGSGGTAWIKYTPGEFFGHAFACRLVIISYNPDVIATAIDFIITADVPTRIDHLTNHALLAAGETFIFTPDGLADPVTFQGGAKGVNSADLPQVFVAIQNQAAGDYYTVTGLSLSQCTIRCFNAGVGVARTVNITVEGW